MKTKVKIKSPSKKALCVDELEGGEFYVDSHGDLGYRLINTAYRPDGSEINKIQLTSFSGQLRRRVDRLVRRVKKIVVYVED